MSKMPFFQFWVDDWIGSSRIRQMPLSARGAYIDLLGHQWQCGQIPDDLATMARMVGATPDEMREAWKYLEDHFPETTPGFRENEKLAEIREATVRRIETAKSNGQKGGRRPKVDEFEPAETQTKPNRKPRTEPRANPAGNPEHNPEAKLEGTQGETYLITHNSYSKNQESKKQTLDFDEAWDTFQKIYPRRKGENSMDRARKELTRLYLASQDLAEILEGVSRYAEYVRRKPVEPGFVISAINFLTRRHWLDPHDLPEPEPDHRDIPIGIVTDARQGPRQVIS